MSSISTIRIAKMIVLSLLSIVASGQTCSDQVMNNPSVVDERVCDNDTTGNTSLIDLTNGTFLGMMGGLYPGGSNVMPEAHKLTGIQLSNHIQPVDSLGNIDLQNGKIYLATIGMSNCFQYSQSFLQAANISALKNQDVSIVNLGISGQDIDALLVGNYFSFVDDILSSGSRTDGVPVNRLQIQAVWFLQAKHIRGIDPNEDTEHIDIMEEKFLQAFMMLKDEFPNLKQIYCSGRSYGGYSAPEKGNPEPYAYYTNWAFKKLVDRQINGDPLLNNDDVPWIGWADHIWADGTKANSDGHSWTCDDFVCDGVHPAISGRLKVRNKLLDFFTTDPTTEWFRTTYNPGCIVGEPCDDNDPNTVNDMLNAACLCIGEPTCIVGDPCDDNNPNTTNDMFDSQCICSGLPLNPNCNELSNNGIQYSFETGLNDWIQRPNDDLDWIRQTGSTPTQLTGPSGASEGDYYLYLEADEGVEKRAVLQSECIQLGDAEAIYLSISVHMFGQDIGRLRIAVVADGALQNVLTINESQGDEWKAYQMDITDFANQSIRILIEGKTGSGIEGDIALDDVQLNYCYSSQIIQNDITTSGHYQSSDYIQSDGQFSSNLDVSFRAGQFIELLGNFEVSTGTVFLAEIGMCL